MRLQVVGYFSSTSSEATTMLEKIKKLRQELVIQNPLFGLLAYATEYELVDVPTACTDGIKIKISEDFFSSLVSSEIKTVLAHELLHIALLHHCRRGNRNAKLWNVAADYVINLLLVDYGFKLPDGGLIDGQYRNMSSEQVYSALYQEIQEKEKKGDSSSVRDDSDDDTNHVGWDNDDIDTNNSPDPQFSEKFGDLWESVQDSVNMRDNEADTDDTSGDESDNSSEFDKLVDELAKQCESMGTVEDCPEDQKGETEDKIKQIVEQSVMLTEARGTDAGGMKTQVQRDNKLQVHYADRIRELLQRSTENRTSYETLDEAYASQDIYLPGYDGNSGRVGILIDTSSSINQTYLSQFIETIVQLFEELNLSQCVLIQCDSKVQDVDENYDGSEFEIAGGGGTAFQPALDEAEEHSLDCAVYLSDLYGPCPNPPSYPLLWVKWGQNQYHDDFPGEVVGMEIER